MSYQKQAIFVILIFLLISVAGSFGLYESLPGRDNQILESMDNDENRVRIGFFSDPHIRNNAEEVQTDFGAPSSKISSDGKRALNSLNANYIFGLGDLTAHSRHEEWIGYDNWISDINAPVYDFLGNHDRDHHAGVGSYSTGYYTEVGRVADTRVLKMGNNVFILISEEHNPEQDGDNLASTIPEKRFEFVKKYLKKYKDNNNIFLMNHVQLSGTVARSKTWYLGDNPPWIHITDKYLEMLENYEVTAHLSGHIHTDYRMRDEPWDPDLWIGVENIGKFVNGEKINSHNRKYEPKELPESYFFNMPAVAFSHGWVSSRITLLHSGIIEMLSESSDNESQQEYVQTENEGLPWFDTFRSPKLSKILGRSAVYYIELEEGKEETTMVTRWMGGNRDVENYKLK